MYTITYAGKFINCTKVNRELSDSKDILQPQYIVDKPILYSKEQCDKFIQSLYNKFKDNRFAVVEVTPAMYNQIVEDTSKVEAVTRSNTVTNTVAEDTSIVNPVKHIPELIFTNPVTIPQQLRGERFIILSGKSKDPLAGISWAKQENQYDADWIETYCKNSGQNYGVVYSKDTMLAVVDADKAESMGNFIQELDTYTVRSGRTNSLGYHLYLKINDNDKNHKLIGHKLLLTKDGKDIGDIRLPGFVGYNAGPGSYHTSGKKYVHENNKPLRTITIDNLVDLLKLNGIEYTTKDGEKKREYKSKEEKFEAVYTGEVDVGKEGLGYPVTVLDFLTPDNAQEVGGELVGANPIHGSETGQNLHVTNDGKLWYCFRHQVGGGVLEAIAVAKGFVKCEDVSSMTKEDYRKCFRVLEDMHPEIARKKKDEWIKAQKSDKVVDLSSLNYNFRSQYGIVTFICDNMKDDIIYEPISKTWYIRDIDGYCFVPCNNRNGNLGNTGVSTIWHVICDYIGSAGVEPEQIKKLRETSLNTGNIVSAMIGATIDLYGSMNDIAYVFDGGKTLYIFTDDSGKIHIEVRDNPQGLKTTYRINGKYRRCKIEEIPADLKQLLDGYGSQSFVQAIMRICASALPCIPYKPVWQFISEQANTGKTALIKLFAYSFGKRCCTELKGDVLMKQSASMRETGLIQAQSKPFTCLREADGFIQEDKFKMIADNTPTYSGREIYKDEVTVQRRTHVFMESNKAIRAAYTKAYKERAYPIEFTNKEFMQNTEIDIKLDSDIWKEYGRGLVINELFDYVEAVNNGIQITSQIKDICPVIAEKREYLIRGQDFKMSVIDAVLVRIESTTTPLKEKLNCEEAWTAAKEYALSMGWKIQEWGVYDDNHQPTKSELRAFRDSLTKAGYSIKRTNPGGNNFYVIENGQLKTDIKL